MVLSCPFHPHHSSHFKCFAFYILTTNYYCYLYNNILYLLLVMNKRRIICYILYKDDDYIAFLFRNKSILILILILILTSGDISGSKLDSFARRICRHFFVMPIRKTCYFMHILTMSFNV